MTEGDKSVSGSWGRRRAAALRFYRQTPRSARGLKAGRFWRRAPASERLTCYQTLSKQPSDFRKHFCGHSELYRAGCFTGETVKIKLSKRSDRRDPKNDSARAQSNLQHALKLKGGFDQKKNIASESEGGDKIRLSTQSFHWDFFLRRCIFNNTAASERTPPLFV